MNNPECIRSKLLAVRQARYVKKSYKNSLCTKKAQLQM